MYRSFEAVNFRCFNDLVVKDLARVNLIAGVNNVGKTALLEALYLHSGAYNPELTIRVDAFRGIGTKKIEFAKWMKAPWSSLFNEFDTRKVIEFMGEYNTGKRNLRISLVSESEELTRIFDSDLYTSSTTDEAEKARVQEQSLNLSSGAHVLKLDCTDETGRTITYHYIFDRVRGGRVTPVPPTLPYEVVFMPAIHRSFAEDVGRFGKLQSDKQEGIVLRALKIIEPKLKRVSVVVEDSLALIYGDVGLPKLVPLPLMGEGMTRLASLTLAIAHAKNGVVLIDEIENGFHYSVLPKVWKLIGEASRLFNAQVFTTTHSFECVAAAHDAFVKSRKYDFRLHRLEAANGKTRAVTFDEDALSAAIDSNLEVR